MAEHPAPEGHPVAAVTANDVVAFVVELTALVLLGVWGYSVGRDPLDRLLLAGGLPAAAIVLWSLFAAPRARHDSWAMRLLVKVLVLGGAVLATFALLPIGWAVAFALIVVVNTTLLYVGPYARRTPDPTAEPGPAPGPSLLEDGGDAPL